MSKKSIAFQSGVLLFLVGAMPALASAQPTTLKTLVTCAKYDTVGSLQVGIIRDESTPAFGIVVVSNSSLLYRKKVEEIEGADNSRFGGMAYYSGKFYNANSAPSTLGLRTYVQAGQLKGEFSEISYLPVIPSKLWDLNHGMLCKTNSSIRFH